MMDLHDKLDEIAGPALTPSVAQIDADIARGRRALGRRRMIRAAGGSAFVAAGLAAVVAISLTGSGSGSGTGSGSGSGTGSGSVTAGGATGPVPGGSGVPVAAARLVAYTGEQPKGFTIDKVPDGWYIQADDDYALTIAPESARKPGLNPSEAPVADPQMFVDKIAIMLNSKDAPKPQGGKKVTVGDTEGVLVRDEGPGDVSGPDGKPVRASERADGDYGATVWVKQASGVYLTVQFWEGLGFSDQQMLELTAGVHVHPDAQQGVG